MNVEAPSSTANAVRQRPTSSSAITGRASPRTSSGVSRKSSSESAGSDACNNSKPGDSGRVALKDNNNNNNNNTCFEDQGTPFTSDDEKKELATLSITDTVKVQNDLHGMTFDMSNLDQLTKGLVDPITALKVSAAGPTSESQVTTATNNTTSNYDATSVISCLNNEICTLPSSETAAYQQAQQQCPDLLSDQHKMAFVEYEDGNIANAARKLVKYWSERLDAFGPERAFLPMTLGGAMQNEVMDWVQRPIWQLLPVTDSAGRSILFAQTSLRDFSQYSIEQELRSFMYLLETLMEDDNIRRKGFIILYDGRNLQRKHFSKALSSKIASLAEHVYPIDLRAIHICHPSMVFNFVVMPIMKALIAKDQRLRIKSHLGTIESVVRDLEGYCLSKELIPATLGGALVPDVSKWVIDRIQLENSRLALRLSSMTPSSGIAGVAPVQDLPTMYAPAPAPAPSKRRRSDDGDDDGGQHQQGPPVPPMFASQSQSGSVQQQVQFPGVQQPFQLPIQLAQLSGITQQQQLPAVQFSVGAPAPSMASLSASSLSSKSSKKKACKSGRRRGPPRGKYVDPRMTMAVKAKMANPSLPLQDALEAGGFVFVKDPNSNGMIDLDGTSLVQRKNNLCRRIRLEKEEQITPPPVPIDTVSSTTNNVAAASHFSMPMPPLHSTNFQGASFATAMAPQIQMGSITGGGMPNMGGVVNHTATSAQDNMRRRDSFMDRILVLPGMNNMNNSMNQYGNFY